MEPEPVAAAAPKAEPVAEAPPKAAEGLEAEAPTSGMPICCRKASSELMATCLFDRAC